MYRILITLLSCYMTTAVLANTSGNGEIKKIIILFILQFGCGGSSLCTGAYSSCGVWFSVVASHVEHRP